MKPSGQALGRDAFGRALEAWEHAHSGGTSERARARSRGHRQLIRAIAAGHSVSATEFAAELGIPQQAAAESFEGLEASGVEFDQDGRLIGAALTPRPTPHRVSFADRELYAWCALDTLFIPGLVDRVAEIRSACPVSGQMIGLTVGPEGVQRFEPESAVLSVVLPGLTGTTNETGPASPT